MTHLHPDTDWLTDYAAGSLADAHALCVSAHLEHCPICSAEVERLATIGGALFSTLETDAAKTTEHSNLRIEDDLIEQALARLDTEVMQSIDNAQSTGSLDAERTDQPKLPAAFQILAPNGLDQLSWKSFGKNLSVAEIDRVDDKREVALHRLEPGSAVAHHDHRGREITVVLTGSFSDRNGHYYPGDFIVKEPGEQHRPTASDNSACVCLSVTDAPVKFTGILTRLLNPVIAYRHPR